MKRLNRTTYDTEEEIEPEPVNLNNDDGPIEIPTLNVNVGVVPSHKVVGKSSKPSRKRKRGFSYGACARAEGRSR